MPGRGSGSSDTSSSSVSEQQEARYRGLEWRTASKKGERDMRERWMDHRSRSLAVLLGGLIVAMVPAGGVQMPNKKPVLIPAPGRPRGGQNGLGAAAGPSGGVAGPGGNRKGGGLGPGHPHR